MKISCVIMAGGKSSRMKTHDEKTIIPILGKPMIEYIIEAAIDSNANQVLIATSPYTPRTIELIKKYNNIEIIETAGKGYHEDLKEIIEKYNLEIILTISGDLPLISSKDINKIIDFYKNSKKPSVSVMANLVDFEKYNLKPTYIMDYNDQKLVPIGINIINGRINASQWQEEAIMIVNNIQYLLNVNTENDLEIVENILKKARLKKE
ncbi:MAG: NTP transferase domain-containing protein [Candidatus Helarchaeota archaeon]